ncbi:MAG: c-type cytochrome [Granulosicoccus sp.]
MNSHETGKNGGAAKTIGLALMAVICLAAVQVQAGEAGDSDGLVRNAMIQRIEPIGKVRTATSDGQAEAIAVAVEEPAGAAAGESTETATDTVEGTEAAAESATESEDAAATETADAENAEAAAETTGAEPAAEASTAPGGVDAAALLAMIGSGSDPEGTTDNIKNNVDGICSGCHIAGVAGAPKIGDKEAWGPRAETGLAAMTETVINGKGAMPPNGGSTLTDEEISLAIQYLMSKQ